MKELLIVLLLVLVGLSGCIGDPEGTIRCYQCQDNQEVSQLFWGDECPDEWYPYHLDCSPPLYEDLTIYTYIDGGTNKLSFPDKHTVIATDWQRPSSERVLKQESYDDFYLTFQFNITEITVPDTGWIGQAFLMFSQTEMANVRQAETGGSPYNQSIALSWRTFRSSSGTLYRIFLLRDFRYPWSESPYAEYLVPVPGGMQLNTEYEVSLYRVYDTIYIDLKQGETLVWSDSLQRENTVQFNYFYPLIGYGTSSPYCTISGTWKNFRFW